MEYSSNSLPLPGMCKDFWGEVLSGFRPIMRPPYPITAPFPAELTILA